MWKQMTLRPSDLRARWKYAGWLLVCRAVYRNGDSHWGLQTDHPVEVDGHLLVQLNGWDVQGIAPPLDQAAERIGQIEGIQ